MQFGNLDIDKIIIHQVFQHDSDGNRVPPLQGHEFIRFENSAMDTFVTRVTNALGQGSKAVQMEIVNQEPRGLPQIVNQLIDKDPDEFAVSSYDIARKLTEAQHTRNLPGGILVVFSGSQGPERRKFLGIIKAEVHSGYEKQINPQTNEISLKFVEELLLTPGTRLYKTAGFFEKSGDYADNADLNEKWAVLVSDSQISKADGKAAAQYFYSGFLGCGYPQTSARTTKHFYEQTSAFISQLNVTASEKNNLLNALTTYLKVDTSSTISASEFAAKYFEDIDLQDTYTLHIRNAGLPDTAFTKDIEHVASNLKIRKICFRSNVKITAPSEAFKELVVIETIEGELDEAGSPKEWTKIIVKDRIKMQE